MQANVKHVETKQRDHPKRAHRGRSLWMLLVVAMFGFPVPAWSQFKAPVLTEIASGGSVDWGASFSGDMLDVVWNAHAANSSNFEIWSSRRTSIDAPWQAPQPVDAINTNRVESDPHLSYDGLTLTFASYGRAGGYGGLDLWQTQRASRDDPWQEPMNMGPTINTRGDDGGATFSTDGLEIIFSDGCPSSGLCSPSRLRRSTRETLADEWTTPELMTSSQRGDQLGFVLQPSLSSDGLSLYYDAPGSFGDIDVFVSKRPSLDAPFGKGENLGATINTWRKDTASRIAPDGSLYYGYAWTPFQTKLRIWRAEPESILGDFDNNGFLDISDIDDLMVQVAAGENPTAYDLNHDAMANTEDLSVWVKDLAHTWYGDANLDGEFNTGDLVQVLAAGKYETQEYAVWGEGDWNGDGIFDAGDLVKALEDGGYESGPRSDLAVVPEPSSGILLAVGAFCIGRRRRRKWRFAVAS